MNYYTLKLEHKTNGNKLSKVTVKHCYELDGIWYRPMAFRNENEEREPVNDLDEDIGWEYVPFYPELNGFEIKKKIYESTDEMI